MTNFEICQRRYEQMLPPEADEEEDDYEPDYEAIIQDREEARWIQLRI